jgi:glucose-1-phosphate adenylyltransferase
MKYNTIALILGGGRGARLYPLTLERSKPAVGVAGKYRLIDITVSNCIHSGIRRIFVITQFLSTSLHRHLMQTYRFDAFSGGFVEILAAEQTPSRESWYQGTADAVRESLRHVVQYHADAIVILSGDHLYRMDYGPMVHHHLESGADITLAVQPVPAVEAPRMGLLRAAKNGEVVEFVEKPQDPEVIERFRAPQHLLEQCGMAQPTEDRYLASMGIYVFRPSVLVECLKDPEKMDFGKEVLPSAVGRYRLHAHPFCGHWEDFGTIRSFFDAHMAMVQPNPPFALYEPGWPIFTRTRALPPARILESEIHNSLVAEGSDITGARIHDSIVGLRSVVRPGARLTRVILQGADYYAGEEPLDARVVPPADAPPLGIGEDSVLEEAIVDKNARIGRGVVVTPKPRGTEIEGANYWVRDGITVFPKGAVVPDGTII